MRVFLDTNVVLDVLMARQPFYESARKLWEKVEIGQLDASISAVTVVNVYYLTRKQLGNERARAALDRLLQLFGVCAVGEETLVHALRSPVTDFEDAVQASAAQEAGIEMLVTRDRKGFTASGMEVLNADDVLARLESTGLKNEPQ